MQKFDLVVIGSGPGGYRAAVLAALRGLAVAIVEKGEWGGTCLNRGCVPKKDWYHTARFVAASHRFPERGLSALLKVDLPGAWHHQRRVVQAVRASYTDYMKRLGIAAIQGAARFTGPGAIEIDTAGPVSAKNVIIATGSRPFVPESLPLAPGRVLTTDDLFDHPPPEGRRVALIGSGVVATELAFILTMLGLETLWLMNAAPLSRSAFSQPALKALSRTLVQYGVKPRTGSRVRGSRVLSDGVLLTLPDGSQEKADWVLLGAGRVPNTEDLNLAAAGVTVDASGFVEVDACQRTHSPHIYAIGDVANPAMTSNHALAEAAVAVADIFSPGSRQRDLSAVPEVVYSALELARVGLNEDQAEDAGFDPAVGFAAFEVNPCALGESEAEGFVRLLADLDSGALLGAEVVGRGASELIHWVGRECGRQDALARFSRMFYNHPTRSEELQNAAETLAAKWGLTGRVFDPDKTGDY